MKTWLYLDDERVPSHAFISDPEVEKVRVFSDPEIFLDWYKRHAKEKSFCLSFDNDLGTEMEGRHVLNELEVLVECKGYVRPECVRIHSANSVAKNYMFATAKNISDKVWVVYDEPMGDENYQNDKLLFCGWKLK